MTDAPLVHHYDARTGAHTGSAPALMHPLRAGEPLVPLHATLIAPPAPGAGRAAVFRGGAWSLVPDLRGRPWWTPDGVEGRIEALGAAPRGAILEPPPTPAHRWTDAGWAVPARYASKAEAKGAVVAAIERFEGAVAGLRSWGERQSWSDQEPAARAVLAGDATPPGLALLEGIRSISGETLEALSARVVENADLFRRLVGPLVGYRRAIFAAIDAADGLAEVEDVTEDGLRQLAAFVARAQAQASRGASQ